MVSSPSTFRTWRILFPPMPSCPVFLSPPAVMVPTSLPSRTVTLTWTATFTPMPLLEPWIPPLKSIRGITGILQSSRRATRSRVKWFTLARICCRVLFRGTVGVRFERISSLQLAWVIDAPLTTFTPISPTFWAARISDTPCKQPIR